MLDRSLQTLVADTFFCSHDLYDEILSDYLNPEHADETRRQEVVKRWMIKHGEQKWRLNEYEWLANRFSTDDLLCREKCDQIFSYFFEQDGMYLQIHPEVLCEYADIVRSCHPYIFVAAHLAGAIRRGELTDIACERLSHNILDGGLCHRHIKAYAENHCHLNGVGNCNAALVECLDKKIFKEKYGRLVASNFRSPMKVHEIGVFLILFSFFNHCLLESSPDYQKEQRELKKKLKNFILYNLSPDSTGLYDFPELAVYGRHDMLGKRCPKLLWHAATQYGKQHYDSALLLFLTQLFLTQEHYPTPVVIFMLLLNLLRSEMIMPRGTGLSEFIRCFRSDLRSLSAVRQNPARTIFMSGTTMAELRMGELPDKRIVQKILPEIRRTLENHDPVIYNVAKQYGGEAFIPCFQEKLLFDFGFHFSKNISQRGKSSLKILQSYDRKANYVRKKQKQILRFYAQRENCFKLMSSFYAPLSRSTQPDVYYDLRLALRTLDAAGDENVYPPEIFAPAAKAIREKTFICDPLPLPENNSRLQRKIRFAFHAGEDFAHIVTGMRRIYETIEFMDYEKGDRLGHALAIGLFPSDWINAQKSALLTYEEFFDNCVWLREMACRMARLAPSFVSWIAFYDYKIRELKDELLFFDRGNGTDALHDSSSQDLFRAYSERKNMWNVHGTDALLPFAQAYRRRHSDRGKNYTTDIHSEKKDWFDLLIVEADSGTCKEQKKIFLHREFSTPEELNFWEAVQDYLLRICSQKGIILEANPSSNVAIGRLRDYGDHPVFRWIPLDEKDLEPGGKYNRSGLRMGNVRVCINSDDPGIFSTTLQNEFRLLEDAAKNKSSAAQAEQWVEKLRVAGNEIFLENYISPFYTVPANATDF